eukprot:g18565.t1
MSWRRSVHPAGRLGAARDVAKVRCGHLAGDTNGIVASAARALEEARVAEEAEEADEAAEAVEAADADEAAGLGVYYLVSFRVVDDPSNGIFFRNLR